MSLKLAFDRLKTWTITGVTCAGLDQFTGVIPGDKLPLLMPRLGGTGGEALRPLGINADQGRATLHVNHDLFICGMGQAYKFYDALSYVDLYLAEFVSDLDVGGNLLEAAAIADISEGPLVLANSTYYGIRFRLRWVLKI